jgi:hypothetical protein
MTQIKVKEEFVVRKDIDVNEDERLSNGKRSPLYAIMAVSLISIALYLIHVEFIDRVKG